MEPHVSVLMIIIVIVMIEMMMIVMLYLAALLAAAAVGGGDEAGQDPGDPHHQPALLGHDLLQPPGNSPWLALVALVSTS